MISDRQASEDCCEGEAALVKATPTQSQRPCMTDMVRYQSCCNAQLESKQGAGLSVPLLLLLSSWTDTPVGVQADVHRPRHA